ncbi:MAG: holin family protein [bacterium]|jgi:hypothetical protein
MALDPITAALDLGGKLIDKVFPSAEAKAAAQLELLKLAQAGELAELTAGTELAKAQVGLNQTEAASPSLFVSGWRPFIGWICGLGLAYQFLAHPLLVFLLRLTQVAAEPPGLEMETLITLLFGMLGLGGMRTFEKLSGVARN